eukprot:1147024-Pelagomonas_calceolata.AAC.2
MVQQIDAFTCTLSLAGGCGGSWRSAQACPLALGRHGTRAGCLWQCDCTASAGAFCWGQGQDLYVVERANWICSELDAFGAMIAWPCSKPNYAELDAFGNAIALPVQVSSVGNRTRSERQAHLIFRGLDAFEVAIARPTCCRGACDTCQHLGTTEMLLRDQLAAEVPVTRVNIWALLKFAGQHPCYCTFEDAFARPTCSQRCL